jgi:hypothetical protein
MVDGLEESGAIAWMDGGFVELRWEMGLCVDRSSSETSIF